jgi:hypothetical protein
VHRNRFEIEQEVGVVEIVPSCTVSSVFRSVVRKMERSETDTRRPIRLNTLLSGQVEFDMQPSCETYHYKQHSQYTYNVTLRRVRDCCCRGKAINIAYLWCVCLRACVRACTLAYPACNSYAPYCDVICGPSGSTIFFDIVS